MDDGLQHGKQVGDMGIGFINTYAEEHHGGTLRCRLAKGKGRTLWATRAFEPGDQLMTESPLLIVEVPPEPAADGDCTGKEKAKAEAYRELVALCKELDTDHGPLWYWCALRSLTEADLGPSPRWEPAGESQQRLLLMLHKEAVASPSDPVVRILAHFGLEQCDPMKLELCLQAWFANAFDHDTKGRVGYAVYFFPSFMSHSCEPNALWHNDSAGRQVVRAVRSIAADEEVMISYLDESNLVEDAMTRRHLLNRTKHFECACGRCAGEYDMSRGLKCPACKSGTIFAHCPDSGNAVLPSQAGGEVLKPLRPSVYSEMSAWDECAWLTMGAPSLKRSSGRFYYEVKLGRGCREPQIGWATDHFEEADAWSGKGVGDDKHSWGADGVRHLWWHDGQQDCADKRWSRDWLEGDVVGCAIDIDSGKMAFSENGSWESAADFTLEVAGQNFYPAISMQGEFTIHLDSAAFQFSPLDQSYKPLLESSPGCRLLDRWSPLPGPFAGSACQSCGFSVEPEESRRLVRIERKAQHIVDSWDGEDLKREAEEASELLASGSFAQHVLAEKARVKLSNFHEVEGDREANIRYLRARCEFHATLYSGPSCGYAMALEEYADAVAADAKENFAVATGTDHEATIAQMLQAQASYEEAVSIFSTCFGSHCEACETLRGKISCASKVIELMRSAGNESTVPSDPP